VRIIKHLSYSNLTASLALFVALGGGAYAAVHLPNNSVGTPQLKRNAVSSAKISRGAVTGAKLARGAVSSANLAIGSVRSADIATGQVGSGQIAGGAVGGVQLARGAVGAAQLANGAVGAAQLANGSVGSAALGAGAVNTANIAGGAVGEAQIAPAGFTTVGTFVNGWNSTSGLPAQFGKDALGFVHLRGALSGGTTGDTAFTLPAGFRPTVSRDFTTPCGLGATCIVQVDSSGNVSMNGSSNVSDFLDVVEFQAQQ
jgi:hypothetical protein